MDLRLTEAGDESADHHWFEPLADHLGETYLRYSFTKGTVNEVDFLWQALNLQAGSRILDVGCGPGRHALALAARGAEVVGIDISERFVQIAADTAPQNATFVRADARALDYDDEFDAAISLCQGAFGINRRATAVTDASTPPPGPDPDAQILGGMARAVRPGGHVALTAFSAYFQVRYLDPDNDFDASTGVNRERTSLRDARGRELETDLWTTCWTPRELRSLTDEAGLACRHVWSVGPGSYARRPPDLEHPEYLVMAQRPR